MHTWSGVGRRMLRTGPGGSVLVAVLCLLLGATVAGVPVALAAIGDATVREAADSLAPGARDLEAKASGFPQSGPATASSGANGSSAALPDDLTAVWGQFDGRLASIREQIEPPLAPLVGSARYVARSTPAIEVEGADELNLVGFALDPRLTDQAELIDGAWPVSADALDIENRPPGAAVEVALSERTATELEWPVGEIRAADSAFPLLLTGTFRAAAGSDDYWYHVPSVLTPRTWIDNAGKHITATAYIAPTALSLMQGWEGETTAWYPIDAGAMSAADAGDVVRGLRVFTANAHPVGSQSGGLGSVLTLTFDTTTTATIEAALATSRAMSAVVAITASAPAGVAVAVLALACRIVARTRRSALALLSARGASPGGVRAVLAVHGVAFGTLPALVGAGIVAIVASALRITPPAAALAGVLVVALLPAALLWLTPPPPPGLRDIEGDAATAPVRRRLRVALEAVVIAAALLATGALISGVLSGARVGTAGARAAGAGADLLVAAVPLLWGLVGCVVALRLAPLPVRGLFARHARGPALVGFLGAARALREPAAGIAPVLALVIGMSSAVTSGVLLGSIQHGIDSTARAEVGADLQIARADLTDAVLADVRAVDGVDAVARIASAPGGYVRAGRDLVVVSMLLVDPAEVRAAQDPSFPLLPPDADLATEGATVPVVLSPRASTAIDDVTEVTLEGAPAVVEAVAAASAPQGLGTNWVLLDRSRADRVIPQRTPDATAALVALADDADPSGVAQQISALVGADAVLVTPAARAAALSSSTGASAIRVALIAGTVGVALLGALTVMLTLALGSRGRDRTVGLLRILGAPPRAGRLLVAWELWPGIAAAVVVGTAVGLALPALLLWAVDLSAFTGSTSPAYHLDPLLLGGAIIGFLAIAALFTLIALALSRRVRAASLLRTGQEG